jgi:hypothetical protein
MIANGSSMLLFGLTTRKHRHFSHIVNREI